MPSAISVIMLASPRLSARQAAEMNGNPPHHTTGVANRNRKTPGEIPKGGTPDRPTKLPTGEKTTIGIESIIETIRRRRKSRSIPGPWRACSSCFISACVVSCFAAVISYAFSTITRTSWSKGSALIIAGALFDIRSGIYSACCWNGAASRNGDRRLREPTEKSPPQPACPTGAQ
jgi:hypothetical protein